MKLLTAAIAIVIITLASPALADETGRVGLYEQAQIVVPLRPAARIRNCRHDCETPGRVMEARAPMDIRTAPQIVQTALRYVGARNPTGFRGPWCKAFANMVARQSGHFVNASLRAFDTALMGTPISHPVPGAYRVNARRGGGHVSIVAAVHGGTVEAVSGNGKGSRVNLAHYSAAGARYYLPM